MCLTFPDIQFRMSERELQPLIDFRWSRRSKRADGDDSATAEEGREQVTGEVVLKIKRVAFLDQIIEFQPLHLAVGDSLRMMWNVTMYAYVNGVQTDEKRFIAEAIY
jgi:hypothetical protein